MRFHHWRHVTPEKVINCSVLYVFLKTLMKTLCYDRHDPKDSIPVIQYIIKNRKKATLTTHAVFLRFLRKFVKCLLCFAAFSCLLSRYAKCSCRWFCQKVRLRSHGRFVGAIYWNAMFCTMFCTLNPTDEEKGDPIISLVINNTFCNAK